MSILKKQHEGFAKFFEKPRKDLLRELIKDNIGETDYLDFKEIWVDYTKLAKHILALANSGGGAIVVGVKENDDGTANPVGLAEFLDKEKIHKGLAKYLSANISWDVHDFAYNGSEYKKLKGKMFQVLLVEYSPELIPILSLKSGSNIKNNIVYVRKGTSSIEASNDDLQLLFLKRVNASVTNKALAFSEHLVQLKELYKAKDSGSGVFPGAEIFGMFQSPSLVKYESFIEILIDEKKQVIRELLGIKNTESKSNFKRI